MCGKGQRAELMAGGTCPPESHALAEDKGACDELAGELGLGDVGATQISNTKRPKGCYFVNKRLWFNKIGKDVGNGARKSVCCTIPEDDEENDDDEEYDEDYEEHAVCGGGNELNTNCIRLLWSSWHGLLLPELKPLQGRRRERGVHLM